MICEPRTENATTVYTHNGSNMQIGKIYSTPAVMSTATHMEPLNTSQATPTTGISEIIINGACHYTNFKVDSQQQCHPLPNEEVDKGESYTLRN